VCKRYTRKECRFPGASCGFLTYVGADETSSSHRWCRQPLDPEPRLAVTPQRGAPSSRHEPPRAARWRELSQAAATAASAAPPPRRPLHRGRFSARMVPALAISSSPCARPSQRARPKNRLRARRRGWAPSARHAESHLCARARGLFDAARMARCDGRAQGRVLLMTRGGIMRAENRPRWSERGGGGAALAVVAAARLSSRARATLGGSCLEDGAPRWREL
jgi:hypothetical protein